MVSSSCFANSLIQISLFSLAFPLNGVLVQGVPITSNVQDNTIRSQNIGVTIDATNVTDGNALHEGSTKHSTTSSTAGFPITTSIHRMLGGKINGPLNSSAILSSLIPTETPASLSTNTALHNISTTTSPSVVKPKKHAFGLKTLEYVLIPVGFVITLVVSCCLVRHVQKVRRKRRLERELLHQYSYPNSEADDVEDEQNISEIDSIVNTQFVAYSDRNAKAVYDDTAEVTVAIGGSPKLTIDPAAEDLEQSTSFNT